MVKIALLLLCPVCLSSGNRAQIGKETVHGSSDGEQQQRGQALGKFLPATWAPWERTALRGKPPAKGPIAKMPKAHVESAKLLQVCDRSEFAWPVSPVLCEYASGNPCALCDLGIRKAKALVAVAVAAGVFSAGAMPAYAADAMEGEKIVAEAKRIFANNCAACHVAGQNVIQPEKTLQLRALEEYLDGGANVAAVAKQVTNGKNAMPAFRELLSEEDIQNVATYVVENAKAGWKP